MDIIQSVKDMFAGTLSPEISLRSALFGFIVLGDALEIYIAYRNLRTINAMGWKEFTVKYQFWTFKPPKMTPERYNRHRDKQKIKSFGMAINHIVGLCIKCAKFSTNYYNFVWRITDGHELSLIGRACLFAAIDSFSGVVQDVVTAIVEVVCNIRSVGVRDTVVWLMTRPIKAIYKAATCYLVIFCLDRSHPYAFIAIWMVLQLLEITFMWLILRHLETKDINKALPASIKIVIEKTGYPIDRILMVKNIETATRSHKRMGAKFRNFFFKHYIFVYSSLFDKLEDQECAAIILREVGDWKMWRYTRSYLNLIFGKLFLHGLLGYSILKSYGSETLEEILKLEPGMHPMMTEWIIWSLLLSPASAIYGFVSGCLNAVGELHQDDFVSETLQNNSALFDAVVKQMENDLQSSSIYDSWYSRKFKGEPTIWERLDRTTHRYFPNHRGNDSKTNQSSSRLK